MVEKLREEQEIRERLRKAEHLAGIGQFSRSIAHEIRNPLNFINLSIDHIKERYKPSNLKDKDKFDSLILNIKKEIQRVNKIAEGFLQYGKPLNLNLQVTDIEKLIESVLELVSAKARQDNINIVKQLDVLPKIYVDPEFIKTCLYNIILNAFQSMPQGGELRMEVRHLDTKVFISIQDTGIGIPKEKLSMVFEPFFTTKQDGLGLGLALTKRIIEEHEGKVDIKSEVGRGSTVTIILPVKEA